MSKVRISNFFKYLFLSIFAVVQIFPFYYTFIHSLEPKGFVPELSKIYLIPDKWSFNNYIVAWERIGLTNGFINTLIVAISSTAISALIAMFVGYIIAKKNFKGKNTLFLSFLATMMVPGEVLLIPLFVIVRFMHINNSLFAIVFPGLVNVFGIFVAKQFMETIPDSYVESAVIDGAGEFRIFASIIMPLAQSALATYCIIQFTGVWNEYLWPMIVINDSSKFTIQLCLAQLVNMAGGGTGLIEGEWNKILKDAAIVSTIIPVVGIFLIFQKRFVEGIALAGIKG